MDYNKVEEAVRSIEDIVFYIGLSHDEVTSIEQKIGKNLPVYFFDFLTKFGFQQDLVRGLFSDEESFIEHNSYLDESEDLEKYVMIGDNGGEDFWMLRIDDPTDLTIYNWVDDEVECTEMTFLSLFDYEIGLRKEPGILWDTNDQKCWNTQFIIKTNDESLIYETIPLVLKADWSKQEVLDSGVVSYESVASLLGKDIVFSKSNCEAWDYTLYSFDWQEPLSQTKKYSHVKEWQSLLLHAFGEDCLVDMGFFPLSFFQNQ